MSEFMELEDYIEELNVEVIRDYLQEIYIMLKDKRLNKEDRVDIIFKIQETDRLLPIY